MKIELCITEKNVYSTAIQYFVIASELCASTISTNLYVR